MATSWIRHCVPTQLVCEYIGAMEEKKKLIAYESEMRDWPHARSIDAIKYLANWRGAQVGVDAAEAFCLLRNIE